MSPHGYVSPSSQHVSYYGLSLSLRVHNVPSEALSRSHARALLQQRTGCLVTQLQTHSEHLSQSCSELSLKLRLQSLIPYQSDCLHHRCSLCDFLICPFWIQLWSCLFLVAPFDRGKSLVLFGVFLLRFRALSSAPTLGAAQTILHLLPSLSSACVSCAEREKLRDTSWSPSRAPRALHPARGQRIGEAAVPGPPKTTSPSPRDLASPDVVMSDGLPDTLRDESHSARGSQTGPMPTYHGPLSMTCTFCGPIIETFV